VAKREYNAVYRPNLKSNTQSALQDSQELHPEDETDHLADQPKGLYALSSASGSRNNWYFDLGASDHITRDVSVFSHIRNITPFKVMIRDKTQCWVTGKGPVKLVLANKEEITISEVYYSKSFKRTCLLSVPQLTKKRAEIRFKSDKVQVLNNKHLVATGTLCERSGLYKLDQKTRHIYQATISASGKEMVDWHRRFGYTNYRYIRKTAACVKELSLQGRNLATCESCLIRKSIIAYMLSVNAKEGVLDLLYMDY
jgi:hypothetical protein